MLGPPKRGTVSGPRMAHDAPGSCLPSLSIPSPQYLIPCPSHLSRVVWEETSAGRSPQPSSGEDFPSSVLTRPNP